MSGPEDVGIQQWHRMENRIRTSLNEARQISQKNASDDMNDFNNSLLAIRLALLLANPMLPASPAPVFDEHCPPGYFRMEFKVGAAVHLAAYADYLRRLSKYQEDTWNELIHLWETDYRKSINSPKVLWDKAEEWEKIKTQQFDDLTTEIGKMELQTHWKGRAADSYLAGISSQRPAIEGAGNMVGAGGKVLHQGSAGLQAFYLSIAQCGAQLTRELKALNPPDKEQIGYRMRAGISHVKACIDFFKKELSTGMANWGDVINKAQGDVDEALKQTKPFRDGHWPKIEGSLDELTPAANGGPKMPPATVPVTPPPSREPSLPPAPVQGEEYERPDLTEVNRTRPKFGPF